MATFYKTDGTTEAEVRPKNGKFFTYEELQNFVGVGEHTMIEIVPMPSGNSMVVNEEGKVYELEFDYNENATKLWKLEYPIAKYPDNNDELIVGNALVVSEQELQSEEDL